jgi:hypothetical protein
LEITMAAVRKQRTHDAMANKVGQDRSVIIPSTGSVDDIKRTDQVVERVDGPNFGDRVELEAFMHEKLTIVVATSTDKAAENPVQLTVQGVNQFVIRGTRQVVSRKYVEVLARAKQTAIATPEIVDRNGDRAIRIDRSSALRYPFEVLHDPNPNGRAWLDKILAEA